jgi:hypothetical protein
MDGGTGERAPFKYEKFINDNSLKPIFHLVSSFVDMRSSFFALFLVERGLFVKRRHKISITKGSSSVNSSSSSLSAHFAKDDLGSAPETGKILICISKRDDFFLWRRDASLPIY